MASMWSIPPERIDGDADKAATGTLELGISVSGGRSVATRQYHAGALKIIRPHYLDETGQVYYITANPGGGYVGGDSYRIAVDVADGASILFTDQSATKVYRTPESFVSQKIDFHVGAGAVLEYVPDQLILYRDADFRQHMTVDLDPEASAFLSDIVTPGWSPDGGQFRYRQAHLRSEVRVGGKLALVDNMRIMPERDAETLHSPTCGRRWPRSSRSRRPSPPATSPASLCAPWVAAPNTSWRRCKPQPTLSAPHCVGRASCTCASTKTR